MSYIYNIYCIYIYIIFIYTEVWISYTYMFRIVPYFCDGITVLRTDSNKRHDKDQRVKHSRQQEKKEPFSLCVAKSFGFKVFSQLLIVHKPHHKFIFLEQWEKLWDLGAISNSSTIFTTATIHFNSMAELRTRRNLTACSVAKTYI